MCPTAYPRRHTTGCGAIQSKTRGLCQGAGTCTCMSIQGTRTTLAYLLGTRPGDSVTACPVLFVYGRAQSSSLVEQTRHLRREVEGLTSWVNASNTHTNTHTHTHVLAHSALEPLDGATSFGRLVGTLLQFFRWSECRSTHGQSNRRQTIKHLSCTVALADMWRYTLRCWSCYTSYLPVRVLKQAFHAKGKARCELLPYRAKRSATAVAPGSIIMEPGAGVAGRIRKVYITPLQHTTSEQNRNCRAADIVLIALIFVRGGKRGGVSVSRTVPLDRLLHRLAVSMYGRRDKYSETRRF